MNNLANYFGAMGAPAQFTEPSLFYSLLDKLLATLRVQFGIFAADNLVTFYRNLSFLEDEKFMAAIEEHTETDIEKSTIWRLYLLCWAAKRGMQLEGDFVECACYRGITAHIVCDYVQLAESAKHYYLYDLFEHSPEMIHHAMPGHSPDLYEWVKNRFAHWERVHVTKGYLPDSLRTVSPSKISFLHVDVSDNYPAALGIVEELYDRVCPGGTIVLEGYGWMAYGKLKRAYDPFFAGKGAMVLELPTGQGLVIK